MVQIDLWDLAKWALPFAFTVLGALGTIIGYLLRFLKQLVSLDEHIKLLTKRLDSIDAAIDADRKELQRVEREFADLRTQVMVALAQRPTRDELRGGIP